jgi:heme exporter protein A
MLDNVLREVAARGRTVVMTSHDLTRAADLASRFDVLSRGKIVASAQREDIPLDRLLGFYRDAIAAPAITTNSGLEATQTQNIPGAR